MLGRLAQLVRRIPWSLWTVVALLVVLWIIGRLIGPLLWLAALVGLLAVTYGLARPDLRALARRGDARPWLVRLREHTWRDVRAPMGPALPRGVAYVLLALAWWWLLS